MRLDKELPAFMTWLREHHPDVFQKYHANFGVPDKEGGGITVNKNNQISTDQFDALVKIAKSYYMEGHS
jgi:hypothetical protein